MLHRKILVISIVVVSLLEITYAQTATEVVRRFINAASDGNYEIMWSEFVDNVKKGWKNYHEFEKNMKKKKKVSWNILSIDTIKRTDKNCIIKCVMSESRFGLYTQKFYLGKENNQWKIARIELVKEESVRSYDEQVDEWIEFRNNEEKYKGTITTWIFQCIALYQGGPSGYLPGRGGYEVAVLPKFEFGMPDLRQEKMIKSVKIHDWLIVTGKFSEVTSYGAVVLEPIRVINVGYIRQK